MSRRDIAPNSTGRSPTKTIEYLILFPCLTEFGRAAASQYSPPSISPSLDSLLTMDIVQQCLSLNPVPYLAPAFAAFKVIWPSVQQAQASKQQLDVLAQSIAQLLITLNGEYRAGRLVPAKTSAAFDDLCRFVKSATPSALVCTYFDRAGS